MITLRFACGHLAKVEDSVSGAPMCACGETRIARVSPSRPPSFKGARGPYADGEALPAIPLILKDTAHG